MVIVCVCVLYIVPKKAVGPPVWCVQSVKSYYLMVFSFPCPCSCCCTMGSVSAQVSTLLNSSFTSLYCAAGVSPAGLASSLPVGTDEDFSGDSSSPAAESNLLMPYTVSFSDLIIMTTTEQAMAASPTSSIIASIAPTTTELSPSSTSILPMTSSAFQSVQESTHSRTEEATTTPSSSRTDQSQTSVSIAIPSVTPVIFSQTPIVTVTVLNTTSVLVSWSLVDGAIGYRLVIRSQPGVNNIQRSTGAALIIEVSDKK